MGGGVGVGAVGGGDDGIGESGVDGIVGDGEEVGGD